MTFSGLSNTEPFGVRLSPDGTVAYSSGLWAYPVTDASGARIAMLYGVLLHGWTGDGLRVGEAGVHADFRIDGEAEFVRQVVYGLHGCFVAISEGKLGRRLYPDFGGTIPLCWCEDSGRIGASADQILGDAEYEARFLHDRHRRMVAAEGNGWLTGTLTAHRGIRRLLPGHALDLDQLQAHRVWPLPGDLHLGASLADSARIAAAAIRSYVEAAAAEQRTAITMTAGFDSRILLAAARDVRDQLEFVTFGSPGEGLDQDLARHICRQLGVRHQLIPIIDAPAQEMKVWDRRVGHCMSEVNRRIHPTLAQVASDVVLTGMWGEAGRARLYRRDFDTINRKPATAEFVLSRLTLPLDPEQVDDVAAWLDGISWMPRSMVLDMAFNELKFGTWAMGQAPAQKAIKLSLMPYCQLSVQKAFLETPPQVKGTTALFNAIGQQLWPEAMKFPVNRYGDWRDYRGKLRKLTDPERLRRYLRDRFAR